MELIYSILKDLLSHHRLTRVMNTVIQGTNTPVRVTTSGTSSDSKLTPLLFGIEYLFHTPPQILTKDDVNKFAMLLTTTSQDMHDIFVTTIDADTKNILWKKKAKLLARINTTVLVQDTSKETDDFMSKLTAKTLEDLIEKCLEKCLRKESKKAKSKAKQPSASSSTNDKEKEKKQKKKKNTASAASTKNAKGVASSPASSTKKKGGGKKTAKSGTEATRHRNSGAGNKKDTKKRSASDKRAVKSKKRNNKD